MKKKILALLVLTMLLISAFPAYASFPDMSEPSWDWARGAVDDMVDYGIIKGYSDNTFRPANSITKGEAMVLFARTVGYSADGTEAYANGENAYVDKGVEKYYSLVENLETPYKNEIAYLIYKGYLSEKTFLTYAADGVVKTPLKRYEAAEFLAKIASGNAKLTGSVTQLSFTDLSQINSTMAPYIKYVVDNGIMLGMGDGSFGPNLTVTRAQMTVMLSRIIPAIAYEYDNGTVKFYDATTGILTITLANGTEKQIQLEDNTPVKLDAEPITQEAILAGSKVQVTSSNEYIVIVETLSPDYDAIINGKFKRIEALDATTNGILVVDPTTGSTLTYALSKTVNVVKDDEKITVSELKKDDYLILTVKEGSVVSIVAESKTKTVEGKVVSISFLPTYKMTILTAGKNVSYDLAETVAVTRNRKESTVENILVGDNVTLTTEYGVISEIVATSKTATLEGSITSLTISNTPALTVTDAAGNSYSYSIVRDPKIIKGDTAKTFYDLRVGDKVKLDIDAATVTSITIVSSFAGGIEEGSSTTISGIVEYVNTSHGYIKLQGQTELIFISKASLTDSSGKDVTIRAISEGSSITVFGVAKNGSYTATMVVVHD